MSQISLKSVAKSYGSGSNKVHALRDVSLDISRGEMLCLWGASGSGKSTLLNILGLLDKPDSGEYLFCGSDIGAIAENQREQFRNQKIGFIFQSFNLIPVLSAIENVMFPLQVRGCSDSVARSKAKDFLDGVGLLSASDRRPDQMSGGQRQRVAIARALVGEPEIVLADEPTANLDSETSASILSLMRNLNLQNQTTFIFSTHDPELLKYSTRNVSMRDGLLAGKALLTEADDLNAEVTLEKYSKVKS